jgi:hypothetical protein
LILGHTRWLIHAAAEIERPVCGGVKAQGSVVTRRVRRLGGIVALILHFVSVETHSFLGNESLLYVVLISPGERSLIFGGRLYDQMAQSSRLRARLRGCRVKAPRLTVLLGPG